MSIFDSDSVSTEVKVEGVDQAVAQLDRLTEAQKRQIDAAKAAEDRYIESVRKRGGFRQSVEEVRKALQGEAAAHKDVERAADTAASSIGLLTKAKAALGVVLGAGIGLLVTYGAKLITSAAEARTLGAAIDGIAQRTGKGAEGLQSLGYAASLSGTELKKVVKEIDDLNSRLLKGRSDDPDQDAKVKFTLAQLGLDPKTLKDGETAFMQLADKIREFRPDDRAQIVKALGISPESLELLNKGSGEIARMRDEYGRLSPVTAEAAGAAAQLNDEMKRSKEISAALGRDLWNAVGPTIVQIISGINDLRVAIKELGGGAVGQVTAALTAARTSIQHGLPGTEQYKKGIESTIAKLAELRAEQRNLDKTAETTMGAIATKPARLLNSARIADFERELDVMLIANQRATERVNSQAAAAKALADANANGKEFQPFNRKTKEKTTRDERDPDDQLRKLIEQMRVAMAQAAGELDDSPEAKRYFASIERILAPGNKFSEGMQREAAGVAAEQFMAERNKRLREMAQQQAEENARAAFAAYEEQAQVDNEIAKRELEKARRFSEFIKQVKDAADPVGAYAREWARVNEELDRYKQSLNPAEQEALRQNIAASTKGMTKEMKQDSEELKEILREIGGFGRSLSDNLTDSLGKGGNAFKKFVEEIARTGIKRVLYEAIGKPIDTFLISLIRGTAQGSGGEGSMAGMLGGGLGFAFKTIFGLWADSSGGYTSDFGVYPKARGGIMGMGTFSVVGEKGPELAYTSPTGTQIMPLVDNSGYSGGAGLQVGTLVMNIDGATDRATIRSMVKQGMLEATRQLRDEAYNGGPMAKAVGKV